MYAHSCAFRAGWALLHALREPQGRRGCPCANAPKSGKSGSMKCGAAILLAFAVAAETDDTHCGYAADAWRITPAEQTGNMGDG